MAAPRLQVPLTALLRIRTRGAPLVEQRLLTATLQLHPAWHVASVFIAGEPFPLERADGGAGLTFTGVPIHAARDLGFLGRLSETLGRSPPVVSTTPYCPGSIPVVFVHGTASSAGRWAEMFNGLDRRSRIRSRYQFWFFPYETGNPIAYSAMRLREALRARMRLDPDGDDPRSRMVLIGHSQGGLLHQGMVVSTGDSSGTNVSEKPLDELAMSDGDARLLRRGLFLQPLPYVRRVVFVSTPHRGSYVAGKLDRATGARG